MRNFNIIQKLRVYTLLATILMLITQINAFADSIPVRVHPDNPHYFEFRGKPTVLVTSAEHYGAVVNLEFDYISYLNELEDKGLNYTRIFTGSFVRPYIFTETMPNGSPLAVAPGQLIVPWARSDVDGYINGGNKFDLNTWDPAYFTRLTDFVDKAGQRGIVVEVTMFCVYYDAERWSYSPLHYNNNINGVGNVTRDKVLTMNNGNLQAVQDSMTAKIVRELKDFDNVFFEICNEPYHPDADYPSNNDPELSQDYVHMDWQRRIAMIIDSTEYGLLHKHIIAQNIDWHWTRITTDAGKLTDAIDEVSLFNFHYTGRKDSYITNVYEYNDQFNLPLGCDETGLIEGATSDERFRKQAWKLITSGSALYNNLDLTFEIDYPDGNQSSPTNWYGGGPTLRTQLGYLLDFIDSFYIPDMTPNNYLPDLNGVVQQISPSTCKVRCLANEGVEYALYFEGGTQVNIQINLPQGEYVADWFNTKTGEYINMTSFSHPGGSKILNSPSYTENDIALRIRTNQAPIVNAGSDQNIYLSDNDAQLNATAADDGLPAGGSLTFNWSKLSGPGQVNFNSTTILNPVATFSALGAYFLEFTASDGVLSTSDTVKINVLDNQNNTPQLIAHWSLDDNTGVGASDNSTFANDGTLKNNPVWVPGQQGSAVSFDGVNDYIEIPHIDEYLVDQGTVVFWCKASEIASLQGLFSKDSDGFDTGGHIGIYIDNQGKIVAGLQSTNNTYLINSSPINVNTWYHIAFTFGENGMKLYVDGVLVASNTNYTNGLGAGSGGTGNYEPIALGALTAISNNLDINPLVYFFNGELDDVRIYDQALSSSEIAALMVTITNEAPIANAGDDMTIYLPINNLTLNGVAIDDGYPVDQSLTTFWQKIIGPGTAIFVNPYILNTSVTFSQEGLYQLRLTAYDGELVDYDTIMISVESLSSKVGQWPMDEGSGNLINDISEYTNTGALNNGVSWVTGHSGSALSFDGINDFTEIPHIDEYLLNNGSVTFWFKANQLGTYQGLVSKDSDGFDDGGHVAIYLDNTNHLCAGLQNTTSSSYLTSSTLVSTSGWNHVCFTFGDAGSKLYLNGILEDSDVSFTNGLGSNSGGSGNEEPIALGALTTTSGDLSVYPMNYYLNGLMDDFEIHSVVLTSTDLLDIMADETVFMGYWMLDENSGNTAQDASQNINIGILNNGPVWTSGKINGALSFDGNNDYLEVSHIDDYLLNNGSITFWFWTDAIVGYQGLFSKDSYGYGNGGHLAIYIDNFGKINAGLQSTSSSYLVQSGPIVDNNWHHATFTFGLEGMKLYVDGILEDSNISYTNGMGTTSGGSGNFEPIAIGGLTLNSGNLSVSPVEYFLNGKIDDLRIYDYSLSQSEITSLNVVPNSFISSDENILESKKLTKGDLETNFTLINFPNPFNQSTTIAFEIYESNPTQLIIYNSYGQLIKILFDEFAEKRKTYSLKFDGTNLPHGMYYYRLISGNEILENKKMILQK